VGRPWDLCWTCFEERAIRQLYPYQAGKFTRRGHGEAPLPEPTGARPGTEAKMAVLEGRARRREHLFHPLDGT
jgi:hypothetical protein